MELYADQTRSEILKRILARISESIDKRVGSIIYDSTAADTIEFEYLYKAIDHAINQAFAETAEREGLILKAKEKGLEPTPATQAVVKVEVTPPEIMLLDTARFSCGEFYYTNATRIGEGLYYMTCESAGSAPNGTTGRLVPTASIPGLQSATITEVSIVGEDEEDTETFRNRYFATVKAERFGGNESDYLDKIYTIAGVGGVKIYSANDYNGGGTVLAVITDDENGVPTQTLIDLVQDTIDPLMVDGKDTQGQGKGLSPIGHYVTIQGVNAHNIVVTARLSYNKGYNASLLQSAITDALKRYYDEINATWSRREALVVRVAEITARILDVTGVLDVTNVRINGYTANVILDPNSIAVHGLFTAI